MARTALVLGAGIGGIVAAETLRKLLPAQDRVAVRTDSGWAVVLTRSLKVKPDEGVSLSGRGTMPVAFAAWDGANQERDGLKAVTLEWWQLRF